MPPCSPETPMRSTAPPLPRTFGPTRLPPLAACLLLAATAACDTPYPQAPADQALPLPAFSVGTVDCSATAGIWAGKRSITLAVSLPSGGGPAKGAVVTAVNPDAGPICYGATNSSGQLTMTGLKKDTPFFLTLRDEVALEAVKLEIVPPVPVAGSFADDPTSTSEEARSAPRLVSGAACLPTAFTTVNYLAALEEPCVLPARGLSLAVTLPASNHVYHPVFLDPDGNGIPGVVVAAVTPFATDYDAPADVAAACEAIPFLAGVLEECKATNGPALVQSMDETGPLGTASNGLATNGERVLIEAVALVNGETLFGTLLATSGSLSPTLLLSPGMCTVETVDDKSEPAGMADVDILYTQHGIGMAISADGANTSLDPVPSSLVVKLAVEVTNDGGVGSFALKGRFGPLGNNYSARADFVVTDTGQCQVYGWSGSLLDLSGVGARGRCAADPSATDTDRYILFFTLTGLPTPILEAQYSIRSDGDHLDPERSGSSGYERGSIPIQDLDPQSCPVRTNNDGKWSFT